MQTPASSVAPRSNSASLESSGSPWLHNIDPGIRWVITEEKDQLWNAQGKILQRDWTEVAFAKTQYTGTVHLYRRR